MDLPEQRVVVHHRIRERHPDVTEDDVRTAWRCAMRIQRREGSFDDRYLVLGTDRRGRLLEMCTVQIDDESVLVFHAMRATVKSIIELGLNERRRKR